MIQMAILCNLGFLCPQSQIFLRSKQDKPSLILSDGNRLLVLVERGLFHELLSLGKGMKQSSVHGDSSNFDQQDRFCQEFSS